MNVIKQSNNFREFHIWDLPSYIRVSFSENIRINLFNKIHNHYPTLKAITKLIQRECNKNISIEVIRDYKIGKYFIPLWFLNKIIQLFYDKEYYSILEKEIIAFRGPRGDTIYNPRFPWKEDKRIIRIVFRLIGDGHGGGEISKGRVPNYANKCKVLIDQFIDDLNYFGKVHIRTYKKNPRKDCYNVEFPKVIGHIVKHLYHIDFRGKYARLSPEIFSLPKELVIEGIKVFGDDEGSAKGTEIHYYSANKELLQDFIKLFNQKLPEFKTLTKVRINVIKKDKNFNPITTYYISIRAKDLMEYNLLIGFYHPLKQRRLEHQLFCRNKFKNNRGDYVTKDLILKALSNGTKTSYQISESVLVNHRTVNKHIQGYSDRSKIFKGLNELGLITSVNKSKEGIMWNITEKGKSYKFSKGSLKA